MADDAYKRHRLVKIAKIRTLADLHRVGEVYPDFVRDETAHMLSSYADLLERILELTDELKQKVW